jgi:lipopolysaccharide/colanic/teichoic acid biosynthesis glycosyltransferase
MSSVPQLHSGSAQNRGAIGLAVSRKGESKSRVSAETLGARSGFYARFGKRVFDFIGAAAALVIAAPFLLLCALAVRLESRGPIFFRQWRVGQNGKPFRMIKFRSMVPGADKQGLKITASGDPRITKVGRILRRSKMDELPQLFNVLRGEMSLVGPRPEVPEYTAKYSLDERKVLEVKPGITGPASLAHIDEEQLLAGRTDKEHFYVSTIMRRKLQIDLAYCRQVSFREDAKNLLWTAGALFMPGNFRTKSMETAPEGIE